MTSDATPLPSFIDAFPQFQRIGTFERGQFVVSPEWRGKKGVYVWAHRERGAVVPRRVGIACGTSGISGRHALHNNWLSGRFKPDDLREQAVRRFTLEGLGLSAELWAVEISDRELASAFEDGFRDLYASSLTVDLSVKTGWIKQRMNEWRCSLLS